MLQGGRWGIPSCAKPKTRKPTATHLSDEELRRRIFANATVLFPSASASNSCEIVYASRPRNAASKDSTSGNTDDPPWQYAMLVRRSPSGDYIPLIRGVAWSTLNAPWSMVLQGLLDATAAAVHKRFGSTPVPAPGMEELPRYQEGPMSTARASIVSTGGLLVSAVELAERSSSGRLSAESRGLAR